jgi:hypothetical protein
MTGGGEMTAAYLPSVMELGRPPSQLLGVFQGRADRLSGSVLAQPVNPSAADNAIRSSKKLRAVEKRFTTRDVLE